jgi:hypothetical protein
MRLITTDRFGRWSRGAGLVTLVALAWVVFLPGGLFWSAVVAAGLVGSALATTLLLRSRSNPTLAQVITSAEAEPVVVPAGGAFASGAGLRSTGERRP